MFDAKQLETVSGQGDERGCAALKRLVFPARVSPFSQRRAIAKS
jgi:hypothetical protein